MSKSLLTLLVLLSLWGPVKASDLPIDSIRLPSGFKIEVLTDDVPGARSLCFNQKNILYVGTRSQGNVYAVVLQEGKKPTVHIIASGLNSPNGVALKNGDLYVAEINRILRFRGIDSRLSNPPKPEIVNDTYPTDPHHGWKFIAFGPDGKLYVPVGAPCNICESEDPVFSSITRIDDTGKNREIVAHGVRNTVGFTWHPDTKQMWFTDNGRDNLGDNIPPDELNTIAKDGTHFGYPYCHGTGISDPKFGKEKTCDQFVSPAINLGPHVAALGLRFYTGTLFPESYRNQLFIAEHGSWNRSEPIGYRVTLVRLKNGKATTYETFAEGWRQNNDVWGRPVDVLVMPDGALLVSDDYAGAIYRIFYTSTKK